MGCLQRCCTQRATDAATVDLLLAVMLHLEEACSGPGLGAHMQHSPHAFCSAASWWLAFSYRHFSRVSLLPSWAHCQGCTVHSNYAGNFTLGTQADAHQSLHSGLSLPSRADWLTPFRAALPSPRWPIQAIVPAITVLRLSAVPAWQTG